MFFVSCYLWNTILIMSQLVNFCFPTPKCQLFIIFNHLGWNFGKLLPVKEGPMHCLFTQPEKWISLTCTVWQVEMLDQVLISRFVIHDLWSFHLLPWQCGVVLCSCCANQHLTHSHPLTLQSYKQYLNDPTNRSLPRKQTSQSNIYTLLGHAQNTLPPTIQDKPNAGILSSDFYGLV